jgi:hydroxymethylbilane synthase
MIGGEIVGITSKGDIDLVKPLYEMKGVGVFVKELENELLRGNAHVAVHSLKDMPTQQPPSLILAAVPEITVPRHDLLILKPEYTFHSIDQLPIGAIIGTSSLRRTAALSYRYYEKQFSFQNIRGNLNTRLRKLQEGLYDAIILAAAGITRLNIPLDFTIIPLEEKEFLYAPGQGALGVECRSDDVERIELLARIEHKESRLRVDAERSFLRVLEGGCKLPIGVYTEVNGTNLKLVGETYEIIDSQRPKSKRLEIEGSLEDAVELGRKLAEQIKAMEI